MKVIDLLNKIANGEDINFVFKVGLWKCSPQDEYIEYEIYNRLAEEDIQLNDEVEIIEEDRKIENIGIIRYSETPTEAILHRKIEKIIDYINKEKNNV